MHFPHAVSLGSNAQLDLNQVTGLYQISPLDGRDSSIKAQIRLNMDADQVNTIKSQSKHYYQAEVHISRRSLDGTKGVVGSVYCSSQTLVKAKFLFSEIL